MGCFQTVTTSDAASYSASALTPERCITACGKSSKAHCAVKNGNECFCMASSADPVHKVADEACRLPCLGNPVLKCGGPDVYSVYIVKGQFNFPFAATVPDTIAALSPVTVSATKYDGAIYSFYTSDEDALVTSSHSAPFVFRKAGQHVFVCQTRMSEHGAPELLQVKKNVTVVANFSKVEVEAPEYVPVKKEFAVVAKVYGGTNVKVQASSKSGIVPGNLKENIKG